MFLIWLALVVFATCLSFSLVASESVKRIGVRATTFWFFPVIGLTLWNGLTLLFTFLEHNKSWFYFQ